MTTGEAFDFSGLYRRYAADVFRFALCLSGDRATAEDIVSETFVRVWGARERVELTTVRGYLLSIARNLFLHGLRRTKREAPLDDARGHAHAAPPPDAAHEHAAELERVLSALATLPESDRTALLLRTDEQLGYEEIGGILDITPLAARVRVHRARAKLLRKLEEKRP